MSEAKDSNGKILEGYRKLVLRWNSQINLISRKNSANRLGTLVGQCRAAWDLLVAENSSGLAAASSLWYFDLGSGAGLPGVVWHIEMVAAGLPVRTLLVEPREKRGWFLKRVAHLAGHDPMLVAASRWGEVPEEIRAAAAGEAHPSHILISLKALHLPDSVVLAGLTPFLSSRQERDIDLTIARFYPPEQKWTPGLAKDLDIPLAGQDREVETMIFQVKGGRVLPSATPREASLVISEYLIPPP
jgi:hypothetical protein